MPSQRRISVGTTPVLIANPNPKRRRIDITFLASAIEAGNVGRLHIGKGFPPSTTLGDGNQGDPITAGGNIVDQEAYSDDPTIFKGEWWATATVADQIITVDEI